MFCRQNVISVMIDGHEMLSCSLRGATACGFGYPFNTKDGTTPEFVCDAAERSVTYRKQYQLVSGETAICSYTIKALADSKIQLSWNLGITAERLAALSKNTGVDLFHFTTDDGQSLRKGLDYLLPFANKEKEWKAVQMKEFTYDILAQISRQAAIEYRDAKYFKAWQQFYSGDLLTDRNILQYGIVTF